MSLRRKDGEDYPRTVENEVVSVESLLDSRKSLRDGRVANRNSQDISTFPQKFPQVVVILIPLVPPGVNHYVRHTRSGRHYVTKEAIAFKEAVALCARGSELRAKEYAVTADIYLGHGDRGDVDNFGKVLLDGLVYGRVIDSDAKVTDLHLRKHRDANNPRTEICIEVLETKKRRQKRSQSQG